MEDILKPIIKADISRNYQTLARASREKKQVILENYSSSHSQTIRSRKVEPYLFSTDGMFVKCYETDSASNKTFKIERIQSVTLLNDNWVSESKHEHSEEPDIFGFNGEEIFDIKLRMSLRAANLLKEEIPKSRSFLGKEDGKNYLFNGPVKNFTGIGRFVLGLMDEIEVLGPPKFKSYLKKKISENRLT